MRRRGLLICLLLLAALFGLWPVPRPEVVAVVQAPPPNAELACQQPGEADETGSPAEEAPGDDGRPPPLGPPWRCAVPVELLETRPTGTIRLEGPGGVSFVVAAYDPDHLLVRRDIVATHGTATLDGYSAFELVLGPQGCEVGPVVARATVSGRVVPAFDASEGPVVVQGCGAYSTVDSDGGFFVYVDPGPCTLFAVRTDGGLTVRSAPVELEPGPGDDEVVELELPTWRAADPGWQLGVEEHGGVVIRSLEPGGPADLAGLQVGDRIVSLDGEAVDGLGSWEVLDLATGPDGSSLTVEVEGVEGALELGRQAR